MKMRKWTENPNPVRTRRGRCGKAACGCGCTAIRAFVALFAVSFAGHLFGSVRHFNEEQLDKGLPPVPWSEHLWSAQFWFESLQNWQSEFLAVLSIVLLSIWLRQKGSPESKPVDAPHHETGG